MTWCLFVHNVEIERNCCPLLAATPEKLSSDALNQLIVVIDKLRVCPGQPDAKFIEMCEAKKGVFNNTQGEAVAYMDDYAPVVLKDATYQRTVRNY